MPRFQFVILLAGLITPYSTSANGFSICQKATKYTHTWCKTSKKIVSDILKEFFKSTYKEEIEKKLFNKNTKGNNDK